MRRIELSAFGEPCEVVRCVEGPDVGEPGPGEIVLEVLAAPVNPSDLLRIRGRYGLAVPLPATPGGEGVGRVRAVGEGVTDFTPGDLALPLVREMWAERRRIRASEAVRLPPDIDARQAAMLRINPATAYLLLTDVVPLAPGDWVIQNVGNSAVGRALVVIARHRGLKTVNVVRRAEAASGLERLGADVCLVDGPDLAERVALATGGAAVRYAIDAVAGAATVRLAAAVAEGGTVCCYGVMSGEDPVMPARDVIFRGVTLAGFVLTRAIPRRTDDAVRALYTELALMVASGEIHAPVERIYPFESITAALAHAETGGRAGKILIAPDPDVL